jgi:hypothetical protein
MIVLDLGIGAAKQQNHADNVQETGSGRLDLLSAFLYL